MWWIFQDTVFLKKFKQREFQSISGWVLVSQVLGVSKSLQLTVMDREKMHIETFSFEMFTFLRVSHRFLTPAAQEPYKSIRLIPSWPKAIFQFNPSRQ